MKTRRGMARRWRRATITLTAMIACLSVAISGPAATPAYGSTSDIQVVFADPGESPIADALKAELDAAGAGWHIYLSMFNVRDRNDPPGGMADNDVVDQVLNALQQAVVVRGAVLHVVLDDKHAPTSTPPIRLRDEMTAACTGLRTGEDWVDDKWSRAAARVWCISTDNGSHPARFTACNGGCLNNGINHNKFLLLAGPAGERVVASTSANWTHVQLHNRYQTLTLVRNRAAVFNSWHDYWVALSHDVSDPTYGDHSSYNGTDIDVHYFPRQDVDPHKRALGKVNCAAGGSVSVTMNLFTDEALMAALLDVASNGCTVRVLLKEVTAGHPLPAGIPHRCNSAIHSKDMIIDARYLDGDTPHLSVWTGSRTFGLGRKTSDNAVMRLRGTEMVDKFQAEFDDIWSNTLQGQC